MIDAVEAEVKERTKLKTLQHDVDTLSAKHDERMSMEPYERAKVALKEMEAASKDYIAAVKRGDQEQMADKQKLMRYQQQIVLEIMEETKHLDDSTEVRQGLIKLAQRMKGIVEQTTDEEEKHANSLRQSNRNIEDMISMLGQVVSVMAVLNG